MKYVWKVGDRVETILGVTDKHVSEKDPWHLKLIKHRCGTVEVVPSFLEKNGHGTVLIRWDSANGENSSDKNWTIWLHSDAVRRVAA